MGSQDERDEQGRAQVPDLFEDEAFSGAIRSVWHDGRQFFSVIDVIAVLTGSGRPRKYWNDLKAKLQAAGAEVSAKIGQLKMEAPDGDAARQARGGVSAPAPSNGALRAGCPRRVRSAGSAPDVRQ